MAKKEEIKPEETPKETPKVEETPAPTPKAEEIVLIPPAPVKHDAPKPVEIGVQLTKEDVKQIVKETLEPVTKLVEGEPAPKQMEMDLGCISDLGKLF